MTVTVLLLTINAERMFKKDGKVPGEIKKAKLEGWYSGLDDQSRIRIARYLEGIKDTDHAQLDIATQIV